MVVATGCMPTRVGGLTGGPRRWWGATRRWGCRYRLTVQRLTPVPTRGKVHALSSVGCDRWYSDGAAHRSMYNH